MIRTIFGALAQLLPQMSPAPVFFRDVTRPTPRFRVPGRRPNPSRKLRRR